MDTRILWYNEPLLTQGRRGPSHRLASDHGRVQALKKIGVYGYVTAAGSTNSAYGTHPLAA